MARILLKELIETEDSLVTGEVVGEIVVDGEAPQINIDNDAFREKVQKVLAGRLIQHGGDPTGVTTITTARSISPGDPAYIGALIERLEQKDIRLTGEILE